MFLCKLLYFIVNVIECFYVNDEPESKFLYTETIKLYRTEPQNTSQLLAESVLHNERIKIGNKVISHTQWIEKGVYNLANFVGNTGKLLTFTEFKNKYTIYMDFVAYSGLILSLKKIHSQNKNSSWWQ